MKSTDFGKHCIDNFTAAEVETTGAALDDVQLKLMIALQAFRILIDRRVGLIRNGMTTGDHKSKEHPLGLAVDGFLYPDDGQIEISDIVKAALAAGFKGMGVYWNMKQFSFHLDLRPDLAFWYGFKDGTNGLMGKWTYSSLFVTP